MLAGKVGVMADWLRLSPWLVVDVDALAEVQVSRVIDQAVIRFKGSRGREWLNGAPARVLRAWVDERAPLPGEVKPVSIAEAAQGPTTG